MVAKDFAKLDAMLTPDLIYAHSTGMIDDKTQYLQKMKTGKQNYAGIEHKSTTVRMHGDSAVAHSMMRMHGTNAAGPFDDQGHGDASLGQVKRKMAARRASNNQSQVE